MSHELIKVCKEHGDSFSEGCTVCQLLFDRANLVRTFWYVAACCEGPYLGRSSMHGSTETPPPQIDTEEQAMKLMLDHIKEVADTMVGQYGDPKGEHQPWPRQP